jgi:hypothetical protein
VEQPSPQIVELIVFSEYIELLGDGLGRIAMLSDS